MVIASGLNTLAAQREVLDIDVGPSEDGTLWLALLRGRAALGVAGVQLMVSDVQEGLKAALGVVLHGASWADLGGAVACMSCALRWHSCPSRRGSSLPQRFARCLLSPSLTWRGRLGTRWLMAFVRALLNALRSVQERKLMC